jgi:hypothetical protein
LKQIIDRLRKEAEAERNEKQRKYDDELQTLRVRIHGEQSDMRAREEK